MTVLATSRAELLGPGPAAGRPATPTPRATLPLVVCAGLTGGACLTTVAGLAFEVAAVTSLVAFAVIVVLTRSGESVRLPGGPVVPVRRAVAALVLAPGFLVVAGWASLAVPAGLRLPVPGPSLLLGCGVALGALLGWLLTTPAAPTSLTARPRLLAVCGRDDLDTLRGLPDFGRFHLVGALPPGSGTTELAFPGDLPRSCAAHRADVLVLGRRQLDDPTLFDQVRRLQVAGIRVRLVTGFIEEFCRRVPLEHVEPRWFLFDIPAVHRRGYRTALAVLDIAAGVVAALALLIVGPAVALAVKATSPGPVLYRQARVGRDGRLFTIVKFRTMFLDAERGGARQSAQGDARITRVGAFLRRSRLDELPQAWNLLRREMALIGPRPERPEFVAHYTEVVPWYGQRLLVLPGLTGWAQVTEGYTSDTAGTVRKLERDLYYLKHHSPRLVLEILVLTAQSFLRLGGR